MLVESRTANESDERLVRGTLTLLGLARMAGETGSAPASAGAMPSAAGLPRPAPRPDIAAALLEILVTPHVVTALETLTRSGMMAWLLPEVDALRRMPSGQGWHKDVYRHTLIVVSQTPPDPITRMAALLHDIGKPATKVVERGAVSFPGHAEVGAEMARRRLRDLGCERPTIDAVTLLVALHLRVNSYDDEWTDAAARRLAREAGDQFERLLDLSRADVTSARRDMVERALRRVDALAARIEALRAAEDKPESPLDGLELMAMFGLPPGRWVGAVKNHLAALVGAGELAPDDTERAATIARDLMVTQSHDLPSPTA